MHDNDQEKAIRLKDLYIPGGLAITAVILGITGFALEDYHNLSAFFKDLFSFTIPVAELERWLYKALQLFTLEFNLGKAQELHHNWILFFARWLAPATLILAAVRLYLKVIREDLRRRRINKWINHVVVFGYGEKGKQIVNSLLKQDKQVVIVDPNISKSIIQENHIRNWVFLDMDATSESTLFRAGIERAEYCIAVTGDDIQNFKILNIAKSIKENQKNASCLIGFSHVDNGDLITDFHEYPLFRKSESYFDGRIFNINDNAARLINRTHAPDIYHPVCKATDPPMHILILGFGALGQALVTQLARTTHYLNDKKTIISVVDENMDKQAELYKGHYPELDQIIQFNPVQCKPDCMVESEILNIEKTQKQPVSIVYFCHENTTVQILALKRISQVLKNKAPLIVNVPVNTPLPKWACSKNGIYLIDPFSEACTYQTIVEEVMEKTAIQIHNQFLEDQKKYNKDAWDKYQKALANGEDAEPPKPSMMNWAQLAEEYKHSNRSQADHIEIKLRAFGCESTALTDTSCEAVSMPEDDSLINKLANMEHRRWNADRWLAGWKYGKRDNERKIHDNLVSWEKLDDEIKQYDVDAVKNIPNLLETMNLKICKKDE